MFREEAAGGAADDLSHTRIGMSAERKDGDSPAAIKPLRAHRKTCGPKKVARDRPEEREGLVLRRLLQAVKGLGRDKICSRESRESHQRVEANVTGQLLVEDLRYQLLSRALVHVSPCLRNDREVLGSRTPAKARRTVKRRLYFLPKRLP